MVSRKLVGLLAVIAGSMGIAVGLSAKGVSDRVCTGELRVRTVVVTDVAGDAVDDLNIEVTHIETERVLDTSDPEPERPGEYVILTSLHVQQGVADGDEIKVTGSKGDAAFVQSYTVRTDTAGCHFVEVIGPDRIVLRK